jgi:hypothetical protein
MSEEGGRVRVRKRWLLLVAVALLACGSLVGLLVRRPSRITEASFERIEVGMTLSEVEALLGAPAGDHRTGPVGYAGHYKRKTEGTLHEWAGDEAIIAVEVDRAGSIQAKHFLESASSKPGLIQRISWGWERWVSASRR